LEPAFGVEVSVVLRCGADILLLETFGTAHRDVGDYGNVIVSCS
jgi:hypothetical protein